MSRACTVPVASSSRSAMVLFPWSMCAMMQKFRMWLGSTRPVPSAPVTIFDAAPCTSDCCGPGAAEPRS